MIDDYEHPIKEVYYILENIPGPCDGTDEYTDLINIFHSQLVNKCECNGECFYDSCTCLKISGGKNYAYSNNNDLKTYTSVSMNKNSKENTLFECNDFCSCISFCGNRLVQKGPCDSLHIKICEQEKGFGLYTKHYIPKGSFICEYAGEIITKIEALNRQKLNVLSKKMNFIFCLNEYCNGNVTQTFVDPSCFGNIGRYMNHSCDPNCSITPVRINSPIPKLAIFSLSEVYPGQELTMDYGLNEANSDLHCELSCGRKKCLCNSANCRGTLPFNSYL